MAKTTTVIEGDGVGYEYATEDIQICKIRPDGTAEVELMYANRHREGTVEPKAAKHLRGYKHPLIESMDGDKQEEDRLNRAKEFHEDLKKLDIHEEQERIKKRLNETIWKRDVAP